MAEERTERSARAAALKAGRSQKAPTRIIPMRLLTLAALVMLAVLALLAGLLYMVTRGDSASIGGGAIGTLKAADYHSLVFGPNDPNVLFFGHHDGIMRSDDGGRTWSTLVEKRNFDAMNIAINRSNPRQVYLAGHDIFQMSLDGGANWQPVPNNLPGADLHGFAMSPSDPSRLYAFAVDHGVFLSTDGGQNWQPLGGGQLPSDIMALATAGANPETLYAGSMMSGLLRSTDGGKAWAASTNGLGSQGVRALAVDPTSRKTVYAGTKDGLFKSTDGGTSWSRLTFPGNNVVAIAVSPVRPNIVEVIGVRDRDGLVYRSEDGGATWVSR